MANESVYPVKKLTGMTAEMAAAIRDYRFGARIGTEAEAIRRLIEVGLDAERGRMKQVRTLLPG